MGNSEQQLEELLTIADLGRDLRYMKWKIHSHIITPCFCHEQILSSVVDITFNPSLGSTHSICLSKAIRCVPLSSRFLDTDCRFVVLLLPLLIVFPHMLPPLSLKVTRVAQRTTPVSWFQLSKSFNAFFRRKCDPRSAQIPTWTSIARS